MCFDRQGRCAGRTSVAATKDVDSDRRMQEQLSTFGYFLCSYKASTCSCATGIPHIHVGQSHSPLGETNKAAAKAKIQAIKQRKQWPTPARSLP